ncbi:NAD(P)H-dependent oxidoreductase [Vibrio lamellibrachiae]|uniref:FMN-dependent NADH-azoreductase n=1 Tax=Vibrio lamellibrachiae TaxID=2910253 RepID=UPI003D124DBD
MTTDTKKVLIIKSSPMADNSVSGSMADYLVEQLDLKPQQYDFTVRDLSVTPAPVYDSAILNAFYTPAENLTEEQVKIVSPSLEYIEELKTADIIVFASPMHNFSITTLLKSYLDQICRIGLTFNYHENGPEGLIKGKQAVIISSAGGNFLEESEKRKDFQTPYLTHVLNFIGIDDVSTVYAHGMGLGEEYSAQSIQQAKLSLANISVNTL